MSACNDKHPHQKNGRSPLACQEPKGHDGPHSAPDKTKGAAKDARHYWTTNASGS